MFLSVCPIRLSSTRVGTTFMVCASVSQHLPLDVQGSPSLPSPSVLSPSSTVLAGVVGEKSLLFFGTQEHYL